MPQHGDTTQGRLCIINALIAAGKGAAAMRSHDDVLAGAAGAPAVMRVGNGEVHIWRADLEVSGQEFKYLNAMLAPDEHARFARLRFERDQARRIVARGLLRVIIGRYLDEDPVRLQFSYGPYGKPELAVDYGTPLSFNVSHSRGLAVFAITLGHAIGIDLEVVRSDWPEDPVQIAEQFFTGQEGTALRSLPAHLHRAAFYRAWTRKEAYAKARGEGLTLPLDFATVSLLPGEPARLLGTKGDPHEAARWVLRDLEIGAPYIGTVVVEGMGAPLRWEHFRIEV